MTAGVGGVGWGGGWVGGVWCDGTDLPSTGEGNDDWAAYGEAAWGHVRMASQAAGLCRGHAGVGEGLVPRLAS